MENNGPKLVCRKCQGPHLTIKCGKESKSVIENIINKTEEQIFNKQEEYQKPYERKDKDINISNYRVKYESGFKNKDFNNNDHKHNNNRNHNHNHIIIIIINNDHKHINNQTHNNQRINHHLKNKCINNRKRDKNNNKKRHVRIFYNNKNKKDKIKFMSTRLFFFNKNIKKTFIIHYS
jgi:hypothetical protein